MQTAEFNRFSIALPAAAVDDMNAPAQSADDAVAYWAPRIDRQGISPDAIRAELREYGAWYDQELADDDENWRRLLWVAACDLRDHVMEALENRSGGAS